MKRGTVRFCSSAISLWFVAGALSCASDADPHAPERPEPGLPGPPGLPGLPMDGPSGLPTLCSRAGDDVVRDAFCVTPRAPVQSLSELVGRVQLEFEPVYDPDNPPTREERLDGAVADYAEAVVLSHSTALSGQLVSPINPRVILLNTTVFLAFSRGIQQVELAAVDRGDNQLNFYLLRFEQACNSLPGGCTYGDLYTPSIESNWLRVALEDDEDLKNTASDCRQCHQRGTEEPLPLMRELEGPWTHFFAPDPLQTALPFDEPTGTELLQDYLAAKRDESYASLTTDQLSSTIGLSLQNRLRTVRQPLVFDGMVVMNERWPFRDGAFPAAPQRSPTWDAAYTAFKRGEQLALPHYEPRPTDAGKQAQLTAAYQRYLDGELPAQDLPDLADIFSDDPSRRAELGLQVEPGATPAEALVQACGACHNDVLDQSISRARFTIAIGRLDDDARKRAIERIALPRTSPLAMPPDGMRQLDAEAREKLTKYLAADERSTEEDAFLERAAQLGMAVPSSE